MNLRHLAVVLCMALSIGVAGADTPAERLQAAEKRLAEFHAKAGDDRGGVSFAKLTEAEQNEFMKLEVQVTGLRLWKDAKIPADMDLAKLPPIPEKYNAAAAGPASDSLEFAAAGSWHFLGLFTETMVAMPKAWEVYEAGYETLALFPVAQMGAKGPKIKPNMDDLVQVKLSVREANDFDDHYEKTSAGLKSNPLDKTIEISPKHPLANGAGYVAITSQGGKNLSIMIFVPIEERPGQGYQLLATSRTENWKTLAPVLEAIATHWYDKAGKPLAPGFKFPPPATTAPATAPSTAPRK